VPNFKLDLRGFGFNNWGQGFYSDGLNNRGFCDNWSRLGFRLRLGFYSNWSSINPTLEISNGSLPLKTTGGTLFGGLIFSLLGGKTV
jgi:hypothetical protein